MRLCNQAYLIKLAWGVLEKSDALWIRMLKIKYQYGKVCRQAGDFNLWQGICDIWNQVMASLKCRVGKRRDIRFGMMLGLSEVMLWLAMIMPLSWLWRLTLMHHHISIAWENGTGQD